MFEPLRGHAQAFSGDWPGRDDLQRLLAARDPPVANACGTLLRLVPPAPRTGALEDRYEARLFLRGELEVRQRNWHDLLNVLVWLAFPRAKAALNARHFAELRGQTTRNRGPAQDALTLLDEGGVIVASSDERLLGLLRDFRWKELFWGDRDAVRSRMRFVLFGHALYEKALAPFAGITARGILLNAPAELLRAPMAEGMMELDSRVAAWIADPVALSRTRDLAPVPILGVPGWCPDNESGDYYDDPGYFRPGRKRVMGDR